jgi:hypothetical protein
MSARKVDTLRLSTYKTPLHLGGSVSKDLG